MDPISALAAINAVGTTVDNMSGGASQRQQNYQLELMREQEEANKRGVDYQTQKAKEMYEYTGYGSKVRQMKEAGLNPALILNGGGAGVTGNISAPQVSQGSAPNVAGEQQAKTATMGMALQLAKLQSEIEVNKAHAASLQADASLKGQDTSGKEFELNLNKETRQFEVQRRGAEQGLKVEEAFSKKLENDIRSQAQQSEIEARQQMGTEANLRVQQQIKDLAFTDAKTRLTEAQINEVIQHAMKLAKESNQIERDYMQRQQAIEEGVRNFMLEQNMKKAFHNDEQFNEIARNLSHVAGIAIGAGMLNVRKSKE